MEFEISRGRKAGSFIKRRTASVVLYVLYGGICELYRLDSRVKDEIDSWPEGMTYCLACSEKGPRLFFRKSQNQLQRLNPRIQRYYDTAITFRSLDGAFEVLTGRMGIAQAYSAHAFSLHGDIGTAMELTRCVDVVESYLFPRFMTKRILKRVPRKETSTLLVYLRILIGALRGAYTPSKEEKKPYHIKSMHKKYEES
ncbi:MAG: hypothetical protein ACOX8H_10285 [Ruminococcus sp.]|jgi:hypothetical protein